jgi:hypothetical protein
VASSPAANPVLCLSIAHSAFRRLVELAELEGVDVNTLTTNLLMFELGRVLVAARARSGPRADASTTIAVVCLGCGRERADPDERRCPTCNGSWTTAVR